MSDVLLPLALILVAAEAGGLLTERLGLTRVPGQITAGLVIGPSVLGLVTDGSIIQFLAAVGALCILAIAGLETDLVAMRSVGRPAVLAAVGGVILPLVGGAAVASAFGYDVRAALFCGAILTATSVGISAATLRELGLFGSRAGSTIMGAAVIDDVLGLVVLGLVVAETGSGVAPVRQFGAMALVLATAGGGAWLLRGRIVGLLQHLHLRGGGGPTLLAAILALAWLFQAVGGLAGITGAYITGVAIAGSPVAERLRDRLVHAGEMLFVPVFLVAIGLSADLRTISAAGSVAAALFAVAVIAKLLGSGLGAHLGGLGGHGSLGVGIGMIARGEVALVAATLGRTSGAIDDALYTALVVVALGSTIVTPILLGAWARRPSRGGVTIDGAAPPMPSLTKVRGAVLPILSRIDAE